MRKRTDLCYACHDGINQMKLEGKLAQTTASRYKDDPPSLCNLWYEYDYYHVTKNLLWKVKKDNTAINLTL